MRLWRIELPTPGLASAILAIAIAAIATGMIAVVGGTVLTSRLAVFGLLLFILAAVVGSPLLIGLATAFFFGVGLIAVIEPDDTGWTAAAMIGGALYVACELAWHSTDERRRRVRSGAVDRARVRDVSTVVVVTLVISLVASLSDGAAPTRTLWVQAVAALAVVFGLMQVRTVVGSVTEPDASSPS